MRILAIGGMPGTGKSLLMRRFKDQWAEWESGQSGLLRYHRRGDLYILGLYEGQGFDGTDRLSMAVSKDALGWLVRHQGQPVSIAFEGDRLFTRTILEELYTWPDDQLRAWVLVAPLRQLRARRAERGSNQDGTWLKTRASKLITILSKCRWIEEKPHVDANDTERLVGYMTDWLVPEKNLRACPIGPM